MHQKQKLLGIGLFILCVGGGISLGVSASDKERSGGKQHRDVAPVQEKQYSADCGSCHFAYQPGLLPARSWEKLLAGLGEHFGENAEVSQEVQNALKTYLTRNAADRVDDGRSKKIAASIAPDETPVRITETRYFVKKHREIPRRFWEKNPKIGSLIRCEACHTKAEEGSFNEHEVQIPGIGRWED
ncbi:MAG: diheme cytochrome c [Magnetococcus sp. YQC-5]